jgi:diacylglycerol O-acyltransferase
VADRIPQVANVVISNVPGPPVPLYMAGARMLTNYPTSIVVHGMALNITVQSYDQSLDFGLMADAQAMPDVRELADAIRVAFDDLRALPRPGDPAGHDTPRPKALVSMRSARITGAVTGRSRARSRSTTRARSPGAVNQVTQAAPPAQPAALDHGPGHAAHGPGRR